jgi:hypothetical protein
MARKPEYPAGNTDEYWHDTTFLFHLFICVLCEFVQTGYI